MNKKEYNNMVTSAQFNCVARSALVKTLKSAEQIPGDSVDSPDNVLQMPISQNNSAAKFKSPADHTPPQYYVSPHQPPHYIHPIYNLPPQAYKSSKYMVNNIEDAHSTHVSHSNTLGEDSANQNSDCCCIMM